MDSSDGTERDGSAALIAAVEHGIGGGAWAWLSLRVSPHPRRSGGARGAPRPPRGPTLMSEIRRVVGGTVLRVAG